MQVQPSGTVTLVFTDIEGSTRLLSELGKAAHFLSIAEEMRQALSASSMLDRRTRDRFVEKENLLRLLHELEAQQRESDALRVLTVLRWLQIEQFQLSGARLLMDRGLAWQRLEAADRARLLMMSGHLYALEGKGDAAKSDLLESVRLERQGGSARTLAAALHNLGFVSIEYEDYGTAVEALAEAAEIWERLDRAETAGEARSILASALAMLGRDTEARAIIESLLDVVAEDSRLGNLGEALLVLGEHDRAADLLRRSILAAAAGDAEVFVVDSAIEPLAAAESGLEHHDRAAWLLGFIDASRRELQLPRRLPQERWSAQVEAEAHAALGGAYEDVYRLGAAASVEDALAAIAAWQSQTGAE